VEYIWIRTRGVGCGMDRLEDKIIRYGIQQIKCGSLDISCEIPTFRRRTADVRLGYGIRDAGVKVLSIRCQMGGTDIGY
jgi:hypothetical protein